MAANAGVDPLSFARAEGELELEFVIQSALAAIKSWQTENNNQAKRIISYLGRSLSGKKLDSD